MVSQGICQRPHRSRDFLLLAYLIQSCILPCEPTLRGHPQCLPGLHRCFQTYPVPFRRPFICQFTSAAEQPNRTMQKEYYMALFLPFGLQSFPVLFKEYTSALENDMQVSCILIILLYLDNYLTIGPLLPNNVRTLSI